MPAKAKQRKTAARSKAAKARRKTSSLKMVVFACSRTVESRIADDHMTLDVNGDIPVIPVMCSGRLSSAILLGAFEKGVDGVLVAGCNPDECRFGFGAKRGVETVMQTQRLLDLLGIEKERVRFSGSRDLAEAFGDFKKHLRRMGARK